MSLDAGGFPAAGTPLLVAPDQSVSLPGAVAVAGAATFSGADVFTFTGRQISFSGGSLFRANYTYGINIFEFSSVVTIDASSVSSICLGSTAGFVGFGHPNPGLTDLRLTRAAPNTLQLGAADATAPVAQTLQAQGSRSGTDTNTGGANLTVRAGAGTGAGTLSSLLLQSPVAVASGTGAQTQTTGLAIKGGQAVSTGYTVATLPTGIQGGRAHVTDANATLTAGIGAVVAAGGANVVPVFFDGTNWRIG